MPYVNPDIRSSADRPLQELVRQVRDLPDDQRAGALNYLVSELVCQGIRPQTGWCYHYLHTAYGVFLAAAAEFYRRMLAPYEDKAIKKNGDLFAYESLGTT